MAFFGKEQIFRLGDRVTCNKPCQLYGQHGTVVATWPGIRKVLFDSDVEGELTETDIREQRQLHKAYWFGVEEIEDVNELQGSNA